METMIINTIQYLSVVSYVLTLRLVIIFGTLHSLLWVIPVEIINSIFDQNLFQNAILDIAGAMARQRRQAPPLVKKPLKV